MRLEIKVFPKSKERKVIRNEKNSFQVRVQQAAENNKANQEAIKLLADYFGVSRSQVRIIRGQKSRTKIVEIIK